MKNWIKGTLIAGVAAAGVVGLSACEDQPSSQEQEAQRRQGNYDTLSKNQPAGAMEYSPTRETINGWIDTWGKDPNKLSYVYIANGDGSYGHLVLKGLPVSYCAMLTPTYEFVDRAGDGDSYQNYEVPAPGMDGAYYSGGQCGVYYGFDAETGSYVEFSVGQNQSFFLYDKPLDPPGELIPMSPSAE